jgi:DNA-binding MarR family transcriptional regulator
MPSGPLRQRPLPPQADAEPVDFAEARREELRTWLQVVKAVLPLERDLNKLFTREFGQSLPRFDVLYQLDVEGDGGLPVGTLAERLIASAGNITRLITRMLDEGLVTRVPDARDRRREIVFITPKGRALYHDMARAHGRWCAHFFSDFNAAEMAELRRLMRRLREGLSTKPAE